MITYLSTAARLNQARARSAALGFDIRGVRRLWHQSPQEFGVMLGFGLLSAVTVERWELGLEVPPEYVQVWVLRQREYFKLVKRLRVTFNENQHHPGRLGRFAPVDGERARVHKDARRTRDAG